MNIAILPNLTRENARETTRQICAQLQKLGACALLDEAMLADFAATGAQFLPQDKMLQMCDLVIAVGGDGSIIYAQIEQHNRLVLPFSTIILTIMGVCLSSRKRRGGIGWSLVAGIALTFSYILFLRFSQMFVFTGTLSPGVALWLPNVLYAFITALLYKLAPK